MCCMLGDHGDVNVQTTFVPLKTRFEYVSRKTAMVCVAVGFFTKKIINFELITVQCILGNGYSETPTILSRSSYSLNCLASWVIKVFKIGWPSCDLLHEYV